ncbi:MAG: NTP transferase domain-containing protein [Armatimonadetes bacterium]|nr:NTP transferase domain-containing protein [Armatimonadota bacterium]
MAIRKAVVPAAGKGTRLWPATKCVPKELLPLGTRPVIQWAVEELMGAGIEEVLVITRGGKQAIDGYFGCDEEWREVIHSSEVCECDTGLWTGKLQTFFTWQSIPLGSGDAVSKARSFCGDESFVVALGDCAIVKLGEGPSVVSRMMSVMDACAAAGCIATYQVPRELTRRYGILVPADEVRSPSEPFVLADIVEKPKPEEAPSTWAVAARYCFTPELFEYIEAERRQTPEGREVELTGAIQRLVRSGRPVYAVPLAADEFRLDVGNFPSYGAAFARALCMHPCYGLQFQQYICKLADFLRGIGPDPDLSTPEPGPRNGGG